MSKEESNRPQETLSKSSTNPSPGWNDYLTAAKRISPMDDLKNMGNIPCTRNSLLAGIASGIGVGFIRSLNTKMIYAGNWAVITFALVSITSWNICRSQINKERQTMQWVKDEVARQRVERKQQREND